MRLIRSATFIKRYFDPEDAPDERTVRTWVERGPEQGGVKGRIMGNIVYVDADWWEATSGNVRVDGLVRKIAAAA